LLCGRERACNALLRTGVHHCIRTPPRFRFPDTQDRVCSQASVNENVGKVSQTAEATATAPHTEAGNEILENAQARDQFPLRDPGRYVLMREAGRGGLGRILEAYDNDLDRTIAIKELLELSHRSEARLVREAKITARLEHPGIVPVHDAGRWPSGEPFYSMKLVSGRSLRNLIDERHCFEQRLRLLPNVIAVGDAIAYTHSERIIHRDLKPSNVIVGDFGQTIVIDWGLAKDLASDSNDVADGGPHRTAAECPLTVAGDVVGTPAYMSPEQARGDKVDERTDVYATGAMLYHVLTGQAPFTGRSATNVVARVISAPPKAMTDLEPRIPFGVGGHSEQGYGTRPC
jgi:eukaryotic-like serine/threonine-protein kinase